MVYNTNYEYSNEFYQVFATVDVLKKEQEELREKINKLIKDFLKNSYNSLIERWLIHKEFNYRNINKSDLYEIDYLLEKLINNEDIFDVNDEYISFDRFFKELFNREDWIFILENYELKDENEVIYESKYNRLKLFEFKTIIINIIASGYIGTYRKY